MAISDLIFYSFSSLAIFSSLMVITSSHTVHSVLWMVLCFFATASIWVLLNAEFLAALLILVYVGAVMVLFLFVVMMLDLKQQKPPQTNCLKRLGFLSLGAVVCCFSIFGIGFVLKPFDLNVLGALRQYTVSDLGVLLYTKYLYPFEIAGIILLVAIVAAISLSLRKRIDPKRQCASDQIKTTRTQRIKLHTLDRGDAK